MQARVQLSISSELAQVRFLGVAVRAVLADLAYPKEQAACIELCLLEAVNNVIEHAYREEPRHLVEVAVCAGAEEIELRVRDDGAPMPEGALERARSLEQSASSAVEELGDVFELDTVAEGGYGLRLITRVMNQVEYRREGDHNTLTMTLKLGASPSALAALSRHG